jgi:hypothetical protein
MLLRNYVLFVTLETSLALPSTIATANVSPALLAFASASVDIAAVVVLIVHLVSLLQFPLPALGRRDWRVILALAAVNPKQVDEAALDHQLTPDLILCTLHSDEHNAVALHMPLTLNLHTILHWIVVFVDSDWHSRALLPEVSHLWRSPEKSMLGVDLLCFHFLHFVIPGDHVSAALAVAILHDFF